jgi:hypothetical protein
MIHLVCSVLVDVGEQRLAGLSRWVLEGLESRRRRKFYTASKASGKRPLLLISRETTSLSQETLILAELREEGRLHSLHVIEAKGIAVLVGQRKSEIGPWISSQLKIAIILLNRPTL